MKIESQGKNLIIAIIVHNINIFSVFFYFHRLCKHKRLNKNITILTVSNILNGSTHTHGIYKMYPYILIVFIFLIRHYVYMSIEI